MLESAYVAGIVDGEGCISFDSRRGGISTAYIQVCNTDLRLIEALLEQYGGNFLKREPYRIGDKKSYRWTIFGTKAAEIVCEIYPYLIIKRLQAETLLYWHSNRGGKGSTFDKGLALELTKRMKWLNSKGPRQGNDPWLGDSNGREMDSVGH